MHEPIVLSNLALLQHNRVGRFFQLDTTERFPFASVELYGGKVHPTVEGARLLSTNQLGEIVLIGMGETAQQIAEIYTPYGEQAVAPYTIERHLKGARKTLDVRRSNALVPRAFARGLLAVETFSPHQMRQDFQNRLLKGDVPLIRDIACGQRSIDIGRTRGIRPGTMRQRLTNICKRAEMPIRQRW